MTDSAPVILLVEDDVADQEIIKRVVSTGATSATLQIVSDGQEALDYLKREGAYTSPGSAPKPDLVLLDLNMPGLNGFEVLTEIRKDPSVRLLPVIVLTTSDQESDIVQSYERGANSYLTKPVSFDEFVRVIREIDEFWFDLAVLPPTSRDASSA